jgi:protease YdgD
LPLELSARWAFEGLAGRVLRIFGLALLVVAIVWRPQVAPAGSPREGLPGIVGADDRVPLDRADWPWQALGRVNQGTGAHCTGTLIAPDAVLTAAHCLFHTRTGRPLHPHELHFVAGYRRGDFVAHARGRTVRMSPAYRHHEPPSLAEIAEDWAIIDLEQPLAIRPIPLRALPADGEIPDGRLQRAGYSQDRAHLLSIHGCELRGLLAGGRVLLTDCDGTRGDSGSPLLLRQGEQVWLVGVSSAVVDGDAQEGVLAVNTGTFIGNVFPGEEAAH